MEKAAILRQDGDFHALMDALLGKAKSDPDAYLKQQKKDMKLLELNSQADWPRYWAAVQEIQKECKNVIGLERCTKSVERMSVEAPPSSEGQNVLHASAHAVGMRQQTWSVHTHSGEEHSAQDG